MTGATDDAQADVFTLTADPNGNTTKLPTLDSGDTVHLNSKVFLSSTWVQPHIGPRHP